LSAFLYPPLTFSDVNQGAVFPCFAERWDIKVIE
jgi:hypothetical protein